MVDDLDLLVLRAIVAGGETVIVAASDAALESCRKCGGLFEAGRGHTVTTPDGFEYPYCGPGCLVGSRGWRS